jgi:hypothetical protein
MTCFVDEETYGIYDFHPVTESDTEEKIELHFIKVDVVLRFNFMIFQLNRMKEVRNLGSAKKKFARRLFFFFILQLLAPLPASTRPML